MNNKADIGVYDSGVGGISFLAQARALLPRERFAYYGDLANAPYGGRSRDFILQRAKVVAEHFRQHGSKALVIACNTATGAAVCQLRQEYPDWPILGMEPAVHLAVKNGERQIVAMATASTVRSDNIRRLLVADAKRAKILPLACPGLVELIETELAEGQEDGIREYLREMVEPLLAMLVGQRCALVLGCTHYIFLRPLLGRLYPKLPLYDGNWGTACNLRRRLSELGLLGYGGEVQRSEDIAVFGMPRQKFAKYLQMAEKIIENK